MRNLPLFALLLTASLSHAATYNFSPTTSNATVVSALAAGSSGGNTYNFTAGTYTQMTSSWVFKCVGGNVFQGPTASFVNGTGVTPVAILRPSFTGSNAVAVSGNNTYKSAGAGCKIQYLAFSTQNVYVRPPVSGLLFRNNSVRGIKGSAAGSGNVTSWAGIYIDNGSTQDIGYTTLTANTFGPSCLDIDDLTTDSGGTCGGIVIHGSNVNVTISHNNVSGQIEEAIHTLGQGTNGDISTNLLIAYNDFEHVHRMPIELQQGAVAGLVQNYNVILNPYKPRSFSFGISNACCFASGGSDAGANVVHGNVIIQNVPCPTGVSYSYGYAVELWGNKAEATDNLIQGPCMGNAVSVGGASTARSSSPVVTGNYFQGSATAGGCEEGGTFPGSCTDVTGATTYTGNIGSSMISALISTESEISPPGGSRTFPVTESITNTGENMHSFCTIDGSAPVPGKGTTFLCDGGFSLAKPATIQVVGMWGDGGVSLPLSYPTNYGWTPSRSTSVTYTNKSIAAPVHTALPAHEVIPTNGATYTIKGAIHDFLTVSTPGAIIRWCYAAEGTCSPNLAYSKGAVGIYVEPKVGETLCAVAVLNTETKSATSCVHMKR